MFGRAEHVVNLYRRYRRGLQVFFEKWGKRGATEDTEDTGNGEEPSHVILSTSKDLPVQSRRRNAYAR